MKMLEYVRVHQVFGEQGFTTLLDDDAETLDISVPLSSPWTNEELYPKLQCTVLTAIPMDWGRFCPKMLNTLEISFLPLEARPSGKTLRHILLANEHSLESLTIHGAGPVEDIPAPFVMSNLRHLDLGYAYPIELMDFVRCLRVPNLVTLRISYLRCSVSSVTARHRIMYDHSAIYLFEVIIQEFPLSQVSELELRHIAFMPELDNIYMWPELQTVFDLEGLPIPVTALHFFSKLTMLRSLSIVDPDPGTTYALNYIPPLTITHDQYDEAQPNHRVVPALDCLHLADFNIPLVCHFLKIRRRYHTSFCRLSLLRFSIPVTWRIRSNLLAHVAD
jgi:hypothetical protein